METSTIRVRARNNLKGNWALSIAVAIVACLLGGLITGSTFFPEINTEVALRLPFLQEIADTLNQGVKIGNWTINFRAGIFGFAAFILGGTVQLGYVQFLLKQHDGQEPEFHDLFSQFDRFGAGFAQRFLRNLYVALWSLLFIIPGIIKSLSYAMTPFIMADHPELSASEAIERSKELMEGHKTDLFILDLTFIGWTILCALTANLGFILLNPYENAAHAAFYRQIQAESGYTTIK